MKPEVSALDHLVLTTKDIDACIAFYNDVLGMTARTFRVADGSVRHALSFGTQKINLHLAGAEFAPHAARPQPGAADLCFLSETPLSDWVKHLESQGVSVEIGPVIRSGATGPITSVYLRDPDGNLIEISNPVGGA